MNSIFFIALLIICCFSIASVQAVPPGQGASGWFLEAVELIQKDDFNRLNEHFGYRDKERAFRPQYTNDPDRMVKEMKEYQERYVKVCKSAKYPYEKKYDAFSRLSNQYMRESLYEFIEFVGRSFPDKSTIRSFNRKKHNGVLSVSVFADYSETKEVVIVKKKLKCKSKDDKDHLLRLRPYYLYNHKYVKRVAQECNAPDILEDTEIVKRAEFVILYGSRKSSPSAFSVDKIEGENRVLFSRIGRGR